MVLSLGPRITLSGKKRVISDYWINNNWYDDTCIPFANI